MSCGTAQVSYKGIRISLKLLAVFPRDCALAALDLTGPSPSRRQETENRKPAEEWIRRLLSIVGDGDRVWSLLPVASCGPAQRLCSPEFAAKPDQPRQYRESIPVR